MPPGMFHGGGMGHGGGMHGGPNMQGMYNHKPNLPSLPTGMGGMGGGNPFMQPSVGMMQFAEGRGPGKEYPRKIYLIYICVNVCLKKKFYLICRHYLLEGSSRDWGRLRTKKKGRPLEDFA